MLNGVSLRVRMLLVAAVTTVLFLGAVLVALYTAWAGDQSFKAYLASDQARVTAYNAMFTQGLASGQALRNFVLDPKNPKAYENLTAALEAFDQAQAKAVALAPDEATRKQLVEIGGDWVEKRAIGDRVLFHASKGSSEAVAILNAEETPLWREIKDDLLRLGKEQEARALQSQRAMDARNQRAWKISVVMGMLAMLAGAGMMLTTLRQFTRQIALLQEGTRSLAGGDLTHQVPVHGSDELAQMATDLNASMAELRRSMIRVQESAYAIRTASGEISLGNTDLSRRTEEQAASLEETAGSMEQITANVQQTAENARNANAEAARARQVAQEGGSAVTQVVAAMEAINQSSARINEIIGVVDEIAFQTNLLALNAAVEAARAGEQGRGFAVVATEVRNLAKRSADAAKEIKRLINESVERSHDGTKVAARAGETIRAVVSNVQKVTDLVSGIATATQEQSLGLAEINRAISQMDEVTQQNAALVEQSAATAESLDDQAQTMAEIVHQFKTGQQAATPPPAPRSTVHPKAPRPLPARGRRPALRTRVATPAAEDDGRWEAF